MKDLFILDCAFNFLHLVTFLFRIVFERGRPQITSHVKGCGGGRQSVTLCDKGEGS